VAPIEAPPIRISSKPLFLVTAALPGPAATVAAATAISAATATRSAVGLRTGFIDIHRSAVEIGAIQCSDRALALSVIAHFDESKALGLSRVPVGYDTDTVNGAMCFKQRTDSVFRCAEAQISYKNIFQRYFFLQFAEQ
jgi:hypothetical protein